MSREPKEPKRTEANGAARAARDATSAAQKSIRRANRGNADVCDYDSIDAALLHRAIVAVSKRGCAIQFGYTRDGGAYSIRIVGDGDPYNEYVRPTEDVEQYFTGLCLDFEDGSTHASV